MVLGQLARRGKKVRGRNLAQAFTRALPAAVLATDRSWRSLPWGPGAGARVTFTVGSDGKLTDFETELCEWTRVRPVTLVIPCLATEMDGPALRRIVDEFSKFARMPEISPQPVEFREMVESVTVRVPTELL